MSDNGTPSNTNANGRELRELARQWDQEDKLAKRQSPGGTVVGAVASTPHTRRTTEGKYGLRRPTHSEDDSPTVGGPAVRVDAGSPPRRSKYGLLRPARTSNIVCTGSPTTDRENDSPQLPGATSTNNTQVNDPELGASRQSDSGNPRRESDSDILASKELSVEDPAEAGSQENSSSNFLVQATLVPDSSLMLEHETTTASDRQSHIPQAEIVDLEGLIQQQQSPTKWICLPETRRGKQVCLGIILFLATAVVVIVALIVTNARNGGASSSTDSTLNENVGTAARHHYCGSSLEEAASSCRFPCPSGLASECPNDLQCWAEVVSCPATAVEWFETLYPISNTTEIDFRNQQFTGSIPTAMGLLTHLTTLRADVNQISGTIPTELGLLTHLTLLQFDNNDLVGNLPTEVGLLTAVTALKMGFNQLTGTIPTELGILVALEGIWSRVNQFTGPIPTEIGLLTALMTFHFPENRLTGIVPTEFGLWTAMRSIWLYENQLAGSLPTELGLLTEMKQLKVHNNQFVGSLPDQLCNVTTLEFLERDCTPDPFPLNCSCGSVCACV